jgi:hypothetical protein
VAFTFAGPTISGHIDESEVILFAMIRVLGLDLPHLARLDKDFYESPRIPREQVAELRAEALRALRAFVASGRSAFDRAMAEQTPVFREMAKELRPWDPERCLASLVAVCEDAMEKGKGVECYSD